MLETPLLIPQPVDEPTPVLNMGAATAAVKKACLVAQELLGTDLVSLAPANQTLVEVNWYVTFVTTQTYFPALLIIEALTIACI
jgi:hypothetical protein